MGGIWKLFSYGWPGIDWSGDNVLREWMVSGHREREQIFWLKLLNNSCGRQYLYHIIPLAVNCVCLKSEICKSKQRFHQEKYCTLTTIVLFLAQGFLVRRVVSSQQTNVSLVHSVLSWAAEGTVLSIEIYVWSSLEEILGKGSWRANVSFDLPSCAYDAEQVRNMRKTLV